MPVRNRFTLAHVTHEAVEHLGGIGTVLAGLMTSGVYQEHVQRSILVGPTQARLHVEPEARLGEHGTVLYSSMDGIDRTGMATKFRPIEWAFNVAVVYGVREYKLPGARRSGQAEVLLINVFQSNPDRLNVFKLRLWEMFGLEASRYENTWDFEEYVRIAEPAFYSLVALLNQDERPCVLFSHEFMGMPTVLQAIVEGQEQFRTVFHAHECATARYLVEGHIGHDSVFYNVLDRAQSEGLYAADVFGNLDHLFRHALVKRAHLCDGVIAVGDRTRDELRFLDAAFDGVPIDLVYNGLPSVEVEFDKKRVSRDRLADHAEVLVGRRPDVLLTHVTRPVISKGLWRDLKLCHELDDRFGKNNRTGVLYILTSAAGTRRPRHVRSMQQQYGWPRHHREGYPDLVGPETGLHRDIVEFNAHHQAVQVILVNQFGWSGLLIGQHVPTDMTIGDFRLATDVELGMATYEPFGISPLEPLRAGAICVISNVCGCSGLVNHVTQGRSVPNVIVADFTGPVPSGSIDQLKSMTQHQRDAIEETVAATVADELMNRLAWTDQGREALLQSGQALASRMGWDQVIEESLIPMLERIKGSSSGRLSSDGQRRRMDTQALNKQASIGH